MLADYLLAEEVKAHALERMADAMKPVVEDVDEKSEESEAEVFWREYLPGLIEAIYSYGKVGGFAAREKVVEAVISGLKAEMDFSVLRDVFDIIGEFGGDFAEACAKGVLKGAGEKTGKWRCMGCKLVWSMEIYNGKVDSDCQFCPSCGDYRVDGEAEDDEEEEEGSSDDESSSDDDG